MTLLLFGLTAWAGLDCPGNRIYEDADLEAWKTTFAARDHDGWRAQWEMGLWQDWPELR